MPSTQGSGDAPSATLAEVAQEAGAHYDADYAAAEDVGLPVAAVARRLGVAAGTLRTWDRRYGLGASHHRAGSHRRYDRRDLERLVVMRRLTLEGVAPADAARAALASSEDETPSWSDRADDIPGARPVAHRRPPDRPVPPDGGSGDADAADEADQPRAADEPGEATAAPQRADSPPAEAQLPWGQSFDRSAVSLDPDQTMASVVDAFDRRGLVQGWEQLVGPTVHALSRRWATCGPGYDAELMLTSAVLAVLRGREVPEPRTSATVLLAPAQDERDALALHVLAAELAGRGVPTQVLAPGRPHEALGEALAATGPAAVLVLATVPVRDADQLDVLEGGARGAGRAAARTLVLAGPGWAGVDVPASLDAEVVSSLESAVDVVTSHVTEPERRAG